jgi:hypothetical protein
MSSEKNKARSHTAAANTIVLAAIGIFLGNLAGIGFVVGMIDTFSCQIAAVFIRVFHAHISPAQLCVSLGAQEPVLALLLGLAISPAIMSVITRRLPVLWGVLPTVVFCFWTTADYMSANSTKFSVSSAVDTFLLVNTPFIFIGVASSLVVHAVKHFILRRHSSQ